MSTSVFQVQAALTALYTTAAASSGWDVQSRRRPQDPNRKFLAIGWTGVQGDSPISVQRVLNDGAGLGKTEQVDITCVLSAWSGSESPAQVETEAEAGFDLFDAALTADTMLGGLTMRPTYVSSFDVYPADVTEGVCVRIRFTVTATCWT